MITPNPKTSGGARWNYLAAWGYALGKSGGDEAKAREFVGAHLEERAGASTPAPAARRPRSAAGIGDVLIAWENEAFLAVEEVGKGGFEIVYPSMSILAEPTVAVVDAVVDKRGTAGRRGSLPELPLLGGGAGDRRASTTTAPHSGRRGAPPASRR